MQKPSGAPGGGCKQMQSGVLEPAGGSVLCCRAGAQCAAFEFGLTCEQACCIVVLCCCVMDF